MSDIKINNRPANYHRITKKELHEFAWWLIGKYNSSESEAYNKYTDYRIAKIYLKETGKHMHVSTVKNNRNWYTYKGELVRLAGHPT